MDHFGYTSLRTLYAPAGFPAKLRNMTPIRLYIKMGAYRYTPRSASTAAGHPPWHSGMRQGASTTTADYCPLGRACCSGLDRHSVEEELKRFAVPMIGCELDGSTCSGWRVDVSLT